LRLLQELRSEPLILAHHPLCGRFDDHFLSIGERRLCRGCFTVYPSAVVLLIVLWLLEMPFSSYFVLALAFFAAQLPRFLPSLRGLTVPFNFLLGGSLAAIIAAMLVCPPDLRSLFYPFVIAFIVAFMYLKGRRVLATCRKCPDRASFPACARGGRVRKL